ncbi:MAG: segregation/condensation protein A [Terracidiphilus sp.]
MPETTIPWWRKALIFALGGIRSGFGLFLPSARREPIREPIFSNNLEETPEEERALTEPSTQPEAAIEAPPILAEPEAVFLDPIPDETDPSKTPEPEAANEPVVELAESTEAEPEAVEAPEVEAGDEPLAEPMELAEEATEESNPEGGGGFNPRIEPVESTLALAPERVEASEPVEECEQEDPPEAVPAAVIEEALPSAEAPATETAALSPSEPPPAAEPEATGSAETEAANEPAPEPVKLAEEAAKESTPEGCGGGNPRIEPVESTLALALELVEASEPVEECEQEDPPEAVPATVIEEALPAAEAPATETAALSPSEPPPAAEPEATGIAETEAANEPAPEPVQAAEPIAEAEPEAAGTAEAEAVNELLPEPAELAEETAGASNPEERGGFSPRIEPIESTSALAPERVEAAEHIAEAEPEASPEAIPAAVIEETLPAGEAPATETATLSLSEPPPAAEPEAAGIAEGEAVNEPLPEPVELAEETAEESTPEGGGGFNLRIGPVESTLALAPERVDASEPIAEAEPEASPETVPAAAIEEDLPAAETPATTIAALPPFEPPPAAAPKPPAEAAASPARAARPTAEEKTAARPAARQKKLDESAEQSPFSVIVGQVYDGPLDLLLDLIRKQDIDIYDIPIARITAQFLAYVNQLRASDVDVAGEFIYTASLLIHIKSRMLLPRADSAPEEAAEDPRRELVERLLEHERFKNAAQMLQQKQMLEAATWTNPGLREFQDDAAAEPEIAADTVDLVRIFRDILERARKRPILDVSEDTVTVGQMIQYLARRLNMEDKPVALRRLLSHASSERALIAIFLALLELVRLQAVLLRQDRQFSEIFIKKHTAFDAVMNEGLANARDDWR